MTISPLTGTDTVSYIEETTGVRGTAEVVVAVNPDGTAIGGSGGAGSLALAEYNSTPPTLVNGGVDALQLDSRGSLRVTLTQADGTNNPSIAVTSSDGIAVSTVGLTARAFSYDFNGTTWDRKKKPSLTSRLLSAAATTNATSVKASAGDVFHISGYNANAAARYLKLYNLAVAPTVGTSTPIWTEYLAPQAKFTISLPTPMYFGTGIGYALTTGGADADTGALTAGDILAMTISYA